jgi:putative GTP pyrophosphokinase
MRGESVSSEEVTQAIATVMDYRASHQKPLVTANNGLRSMVRTENCEVEVSQRLKRFPTILDKLRREPSLSLPNMQDIAGVRAVLNSIDEVRRVQARLTRNRPPVRISDYITSPRESGYRGVHVVVTYNGRLVEVQLRTRVMHDWAVTVERLSSRMGSNLKGDGDHVVQAFLAAVSEAMALEELGMDVPQELLTRITTLRSQSTPYL